MTITYEPSISAIPLTLRAACEKLSDRIEMVVKDEDGIWIYCSQGWWNPMLETSFIHEDTAKECILCLTDLEKKPVDSSKQPV